MHVHTHTLVWPLPQSESSCLPGGAFVALEEPTPTPQGSLGALRPVYWTNACLCLSLRQGMESFPALKVIRAHLFSFFHISDNY